MSKATEVLLLKQFLVYVREGCVIHRLDEGDSSHLKWFSLVLNFRLEYTRDLTDSILLHFGAWLDFGTG